jgi:peptide-methionine (R)-S-oxide reductase
MLRFLTSDLALLALSVSLLGIHLVRHSSAWAAADSARAEESRDGRRQAAAAKDARSAAMIEKVHKSDAEWRKLLTPQEFEITRRKGTEPARSGKYWNHHAVGLYKCVCCGAELFSSDAKYDSGSGWPSFWAPVSTMSVRTVLDRSLPEVRQEVLCSRCDAHLGHVFADGPKPRGLRYCVNSAALRFEEEGK